MTNLCRVTWTETVRYTELLELPEDWDRLESQCDWIADHVTDLDEAYYTCEGRVITSVDPVTPEDAGMFYQLESGRRAHLRLTAERDEQRQILIAQLREAVNAVVRAEARAEESGVRDDADVIENEIAPIARRLLPYL